MELAFSWWSRLRGYLGRPEPAPGEGILLFPCNGVHTYGMHFDLDVLFLDAEGRVLQLIRSLSPWKRTGRVSRARYVLEARPGMIDASATQVGDMLTWWDPAPVPVSEKLSGRRERPKQQSVVSARGNE